MFSNKFGRSLQTSFALLLALVFLAAPGGTPTARLRDPVIGQTPTLSLDEEIDYVDRLTGEEFKRTEKVKSFFIYEKVLAETADRVYYLVHQKRVLQKSSKSAGSSETNNETIELAGFESDLYRIAIRLKDPSLKGHTLFPTLKVKIGKLENLPRSYSPTPLKYDGKTYAPILLSDQPVTLFELGYSTLRNPKKSRQIFTLEKNFLLGRGGFGDVHWVTVFDEVSQSMQPRVAKTLRLESDPDLNPSLPKRYQDVILQRLPADKVEYTNPIYAVGTEYSPDLSERSRNIILLIRPEDGSFESLQRRVDRLPSTNGMTVEVEEPGVFDIAPRMGESEPSYSQKKSFALRLYGALHLASDYTHHLEELHRAGLTQWDAKPSNILYRISTWAKQPGREISPKSPYHLAYLFQNDLIRFVGSDLDLVSPIGEQAVPGSENIFGTAEFMTPLHWIDAQVRERSRFEGSKLVMEPWALAHVLYDSLFGSSALTAYLDRSGLNPFTSGRGNSSSAFEYIQETLGLLKEENFRKFQKFIQDNFKAMEALYAEEFQKSPEARIYWERLKRLIQTGFQLTTQEIIRENSATTREPLIVFDAEGKIVGQTILKDLPPLSPLLEKQMKEEVFPEGPKSERPLPQKPWLPSCIWENGVRPVVPD